MGYSSSRTAPAWVPSRGCSPSGTDCSSVGPRGVTSPASKPAPAWAPLSTAPQVHRTSLHGSAGSLGRASHGLTASFGRIHLLRRGVLHGLQVDVCSTIHLHGLQGDSLPHHGLPHGLQGNLCSAAWSTSSPPSSLTLVSAELLLSHILTPLSGCNCCCAVAFFPLLRYVIPEALPPSLMGSALASNRSVLEPAGIDFIGHRGSFQQLLTEATPVAPQLPRPCQANPIQSRVHTSNWT